MMMSDRKPLCYVEFCCNVATVEVVTVNRSGDPDRLPIEWGWCDQHSWQAPTTHEQEPIR